MQRSLGFKGCITVFPSMGESDANHSSCISDWQCTKHEFMNNPLETEFPCSSTALRKSSLNPEYGDMKVEQYARSDMWQVACQVEKRRQWAGAPTLQYLKLLRRTLVYIMLAATPFTVTISNSWYQNVSYLLKGCLYKRNIKNISNSNPDICMKQIWRFPNHKFITCHESYAALRMNRGVCICFTSFWGKKHCIEAKYILRPGNPVTRQIQMHTSNAAWNSILPCLEVTSKCMKRVNSLPTPKAFEKNVIRLQKTDRIYSWKSCNKISFLFHLCS